LTALTLSDVCFDYGGEPVLRGVTFEVRPGETVALLGRNGAGKTTITRLVMGLLHPARGEILVMGVPNMEQAPEEIARDAAYVFQHSDQQLFASTAIEEVAFAPRQAGRSTIDARDLAFHALLDVGLESHAESHPYDLSPAERKLLALAAALAQRPRVLILDEPTQGLDAGFKERVYGILRDQAARRVAILAVSHDLGLVAEIADRAVVLEGGVVAADLAAADLVRDEPLARQLGLPLPETARLSLALGLPGTPIRRAEVVDGLRRIVGERG
jgi:energy-coupling factor transport system ATP-binding protein